MKKNYIVNFIYVSLSCVYLKIFRKSLKNTNNALVNLYSIDNGKTLIFFHNTLKTKRLKKTKISNTIYENHKPLISAEELNEKGYAKLSQNLNTNHVNELVKLATTLKCFNGEKFVLFDEKSITNTRYNFDSNDLINQSSIQQLIMDEYLIDIAREYFDSEPIFDIPVMWWSTPFGNVPSSNAAQLYHYDLERVKWLKIFFYLTDVNDSNGPHQYIEKSHKVNSKPIELLSKGYKRISDDEIGNYYNIDSFKVIKGLKGSAFAADTLCWHKGTKLIKGNRLVLELNYASSLLGTNHEKLKVKTPTDSFKLFCKKNSFYTKNFKFEKLY